MGVAPPTHKWPMPPWPLPLHEALTTIWGFQSRKTNQKLDRHLYRKSTTFNLYSIWQHTRGCGGENNLYYLRWKNINYSHLYPSCYQILNSIYINKWNNYLEFKQQCWQLILNEGFQFKLYPFVRWRKEEDFNQRSWFVLLYFILPPCPFFPPWTRAPDPGHPDPRAKEPDLSPLSTRG